MRMQSTEYLEKLFINDVNELARLGREDPRTDYIRLQMSAILRRLVLDEHSLLSTVGKNYDIPLLCIVPEPKSGNPKFHDKYQIPEVLQGYAPVITNDNFPFGQDAYFNYGYELDEYLDRWHSILFGREITPREIIKFLANKLGGVHADILLKDINEKGGRSVDAHTLWEINERMSIDDQKALYQHFDSIVLVLWRACAPLCNFLYNKYKE